MICKTLTTLHEPWLVTESLHHAIRGTLEVLMEDPIQMKTIAEMIAKEGEGNRKQRTQEEDSNFWEMEEMPSEGERADLNFVVIPLNGVMMKNPSILEQVLLDGTDTEALERSIREATADPSIDGILLDVDSGGGSVSGVPETASAVRDATKEKPVIAYSGGITGSAAFWVASQADMMVGTESARFGAIGVYLPFLDASKAFEQDGLKLDVITNKEGTFKGSGLHGTSLSEEQRAQLQNEVQEIYGLFKKDVEGSRPNISGETMRGQTFLGSSAKREGLIDVMGNRIDALTLLAAEVSRRQSIMES